MPRRKFIRGVIDPVSLIGVLFLIITLSVGTHVVADKKYDFNIFEQAAKSKKTGNSAFDKCREESGREVCNERLGINVNWKGEIVEKIDTSKVDENVTKPGDPTCDANGVQYSAGAVVMYGGIGSNATCGSDGKWDVGVGATAAIIPENLPEYAKGSDKLKKQIEDEEAVAEAEKQAVIEQAIEPEEVEQIQKVIEQEQKTQAAIQTQPTVTTETGPVNPFANITAGVSGGTIPQKQYVPPLLPTVPTAEDLLRKLPGLEKLNINEEETKKTLLDNLASLSTQFSNALNNSELEGLGTYGLGGGNAYVAPVPQNIIKSQNNSDLYNYMLGNTISAGAGFASTTILTPGAPMFVFETAISIPGAIRLLTAADIADNIVTGGACALGNQESCSYFQSTLFIPAPTGVGNMLVDSIDDFATSWAGTGSTLSNLINKMPSPALFNPSSSFDSFIPTNTTTDLANAISPTQTDMFFAPALDNLPNTPARVIMDDLSRPLPDVEISNPITTILDWWNGEMAKTNPNAFKNIGFELRSPIGTDGKLQLPFEKVTVPVSEVPVAKTENITPSPPLTGFAKVQEQAEAIAKDILDGSFPTGVGLSPLKYVAGGIISAAFLDNYFDWGIIDYIETKISNLIPKDPSPSPQINLEQKTEENVNTSQINLSQSPKTQNKPAIAPKFYTQTDPEFDETQIITSTGSRPFELIGCGPTTVANILNQLNLATVSPLDIANSLGVIDWGYNGTTLFQDSTLLKTLTSYGVEPELYNKSFYNLQNYTSQGDLILIGGNFRYQGRDIPHISYIEIGEDNEIILKDNLLVENGMCEIIGNSNLKCMNDFGETLTINLENSPIYIIKPST